MNTKTKLANRNLIILSLECRRKLFSFSFILSSSQTNTNRKQCYCVDNNGFVHNKSQILRELTDVFNKKKPVIEQTLVSPSIPYLENGMFNVKALKYIRLDTQEEYKYIQLLAKSRTQKKFCNK